MDVDDVGVNVACMNQSKERVLRLEPTNEGVALEDCQVYCCRGDLDELTEAHPVSAGQW